MAYRFAPVAASVLAAAFAVPVPGCRAAENPERLGPVQLRSIALEADDVRAFAAPPAGFDTAQPGIAQGSIVEFTYESAITGTRRKASVYLPAGYSAQRRYPVLYLLHGLAGNHHEWPAYVRAGAVLDTAIAAGKAVPMIVVMPNGRALPDDRPPPDERKFSPEHIAGFANFERDLLESLIPAIDKAYPTLAGRGQRAIAGLSMGGGQALNYGLGHLESFAWVGGFSAAPNTRAAASLLPQSSAARSRLQLLYLSCGKQDGLIAISQDFHRSLRQNKVPHVWHVDDYGHDRESWAESLYHFSQLIFRPPQA
ncbi:MAG TPA: alpha/beta hydrolase-fold protein [Pseudoduganella sp.]